MPRYESVLLDHSGNRIDLQPVGGGVARVVGGVGVLYTDLQAPFDLRQVQIDQLLSIWRGLEVGPMQKMNVGFVRKIRVFNNDNGARIYRLIAMDINELSTRRIVAYDQGSAQAEKTDSADDMMKAVVRDNFTTATDTDRNIGDFVFVVEDESEGVSITRAFARQEVNTVLDDLVEVSAVNTPVVYHQWEQIENQYKFRFATYPGQIGIDHTEIQLSPVVFSEDFENIEDPEIEMDYSGEINFVYGLGQGVEGERLVVTAQDDNRINRSPVNRREGVVTATNTGTTAAVQAAADAALAAGLPQLRFRGRLLDVEPFRFGREWNFGDRVPVRFAGMTFNALVSAFSLNWDERGEEFEVWARVTDVLTE